MLDKLWITKNKYLAISVHAYSSSLSLPFPKARNKEEYTVENPKSMMEMPILKICLEENIAVKENSPDIPVTGMAVLHQQFLLIQAIEEWIAALKRDLK